MCPRKVFTQAIDILIAGSHQKVAKSAWRLPKYARTARDDLRGDLKERRDLVALQRTA